jgi:hypothetical protein
MAKSADTTSTKSSVVSGKAASIKKTAKKSAQAIARPFKRFKQSLSGRSATRSTISRSSTVLPSDHEASDHEPDNGSARSGSEPEELTPEKELGSSLT